MAERGTFYCLQNVILGEAIQHFWSIDKSLVGDKCLIRYGENKNKLTLLFVDRRGWSVPEMGRNRKLLDRIRPLFSKPKPKNVEHIDPYHAVCSLAVQRNLSWLNLFVQEGSIWEYVAYRADKGFQQFSTFRAYWGEDTNDQSEWMGNAAQLAEMFSVTKERSERYLIPWKREGDDFVYEMAYPDDESSSGQVHQYCDFMKAMGFAFPDQEANQVDF